MKKATLKNGLKIALVAGGVVALVPTVHGQGIGLQTLDRMLVASPQTLERGETIYQEQCATCHGDQGLGGAPLGERLGAQGFVNVDVERSGLYSIYSVVAFGIDEAEHPIFENLFYQDQWAVTHYVHSLIDDPQPDPPEVVERVREIAQFGLCDPDIRAGIANFLQPEDEAQLQHGQEVYNAQCASCHGAQGLGDGPAGAAVGARNFQDDPNEWTNGTSPLAIFNTLQQGIIENGMPAYAHLDDDTNWALTHYVRESFVPVENRQEVTEAQIEEACRALSAPPTPPAIPIERAMAFLAMDQEHHRFIQLESYGDPQLDPDADPIRGEVVYQASCASCHGESGAAPDRVGPFGAFPPYLFLEIRDLVPASAGGTYRDFAQRTIFGPHGTLPTMTNVSSLTDQNWKDLHAYIAGFEGHGSDRVRLATPPSPEPADEAEGDGEELSAEPEGDADPQDPENEAELPESPTEEED